MKRTQEPAGSFGKRLQRTAVWLLAETAGGSISRQQRRAAIMWWILEGAESCNTNNMLKLTEGLFRVSPQARYADYYERALFNHILSTQHPEHGGYVYFTPARPRHYRVYSAPNQGMWCCVGTGMENHGKYNEFIFTHQNNALYLNLFIASELNWKEKGIQLRQETHFPFEEKTRLQVTDGSARFELKIRYPVWVADGELKVTVNGDDFPV